MKSLVKILPCSYQTNNIKGIIQEQFCSLTLKANCILLHPPFTNKKHISCSHPMPKVAISKQHGVNGSKQFKCNLFPSSDCVSVQTSLMLLSSKYIHMPTQTNKYMQVHTLFHLPISPFPLFSLSSEDMSLNTLQFLTEIKVFALVTPEKNK